MAEMPMHLELRRIAINDVRFGTRFAIEDGVLSIDAEALRRVILEDERLCELKIDIARPGESVRIVPVKDVIEPRAKLSGDEIFPGTSGKVAAAGRGISCVLSGCAVVTTGPIVGFQEGIIDMSGPLTAYTPFAWTNNIVLDIAKAKDVSPHDHEEAVRLAGIRAAHYIADQVKDYPDFETEYYEWESIAAKAARYPDLPKVAYICQIMSQGLLHDSYFYGKDSKRMLPTLVSPLEVFDGALVSGNCVSPGSKTTTYHHQNNAVLKELFRRDGRELCFIGMILSPLMTTLDDKYRCTLITAQLAELLGAEGAIQSQEGFGNPTTDLMMICQALEERGIRSVLISNEDAGVDGKSEPLPDGSERADAIVSTGNSNATIDLPPMHIVLGQLAALEQVTGGFAGSIKPDGSLTIEIHGIIGSHNLQGSGKLGAVTI